MTPLSRPSAEEIRGIALKCGAAACGVIPAQKLEEHRRFLEAVRSVPPDLSYLGRVPAARENIKNWFGTARSVLVCAFQYWHSGRNYAAALEQSVRGGGGKVSRYALVPDYHEVVKKKLKEMLDGIRKLGPGADGKPFVDTSPVMEKELGRLAGLGFRGKNTLLISEELGSYFFIGGLALDFDAAPAPARVSAASCGECRRCIDACPTGALAEPGVLKPELCVSYWTTQSRTKMPEALQLNTGGFLRGCDLCQECCPYNADTPDKLTEEFKDVQYYVVKGRS
ncbi:MAG: tRNA epoxyqueuosine(34) reductase QueG [Elusimicrobia bacterium RIFOXYB2_FULL_62_6]|nr:MAG: tRNA epoxyqueuosine(34) reductase QueG [Elusimicrobia bacterium RIFOXYB2_FULL_62_6]